MSEYTELARHVRHDLIKNLDIPQKAVALSVPELRVLNHRLFEAQSGLCAMVRVWCPRIRESAQWQATFEPWLAEIEKQAAYLEQNKKVVQAGNRRAVTIPDPFIDALNALSNAVRQFEACCVQAEQNTLTSRPEPFGDDEMAALSFMGLDLAMPASEAAERMVIEDASTEDLNTFVDADEPSGTPLSPEDTSKIRVLVVDDQQVSIERLQARESLQARFSWVTMCHRATHCNVCEHADTCTHRCARSWNALLHALRWERTHGGRIDLLLMDVRFDTLDPHDLLWIPEKPTLNDEDHVKALQGLIIARALRRDPEFSRLPIILMTALSRLPDGANQLLEDLEGLQFVDDDNSLDALAARMDGVVRQRLEIPDETRFFWGTSPRMQVVRHQAELMSFGPRTVLITGPSGAGKSYIVENVIYPRSGRHPLVTLDLSAVPENLVESELFGHVKGAFSGATHDRPGLIEEARGGILFLDEIGNLSPENQKKLLLFLNDKMLRRVGAAFSTRHHVDVKVVAATHLDLAKEVEAGRFRFDLYMRLAPALAIELPNLAERRQDLGAMIKMLVLRHTQSEEVRPFVEEYAKKCHVQPTIHVEFGTQSIERPKDALTLRFGQATRELFENYAWPGNTRELESILDAIVIKTFYDARFGNLSGTTLEIDHYFAMSLLGQIHADDLAPESETPTPSQHQMTWPEGPFDGFSDMRASLERAYLRNAFAHANGNMAQLAQNLFGDASPQTQHKVTIRFNQLGLRLRDLRNQ